MADQPHRVTLRSTVTTAGVTSAAFLLAAAAAMPAFADDGGSGHPNNGHHYGQTKDQSSQSGANSQGQADSQSDDQANGQAHGQAKGQSAGHSSASASSKDASASDSDPAGNNGTVKIHDVYGDTAHHNVPHVDCDFAVAFWGFDADQTLNVSFAGQAPTGKDTALTVTGAPTSITSPDAAGGGQDYDGELQFTADELNLSSLGDPHPKQGYHVKLTVSTGAPGGYKYKVFWLQPCTTTAAPTQSGATIESGATTQTPTAVLGENATKQTGQSTAATSAESGTTATAAGIPTEVLGEHITRGSTPAAATAPAAASLPFTGAEIGGLAAAAAIALGAGTMLTVAGRRRRRRTAG